MSEDNPVAQKLRHVSYYGRSLVSHWMRVLVQAGDHDDVTVPAITGFMAS